MACGCQGGKKTLPAARKAGAAPAAAGAGQRYVLISPGGGRTYFQSEGQAREENRRAGGRGLVRPA